MLRSLLDKTNLDRKNNAGSCTVRFRVQWAGYSPTEHQADFWKLKDLNMPQEGVRLIKRSGLNGCRAE